MKKTFPPLLAVIICFLIISVTSCRKKESEMTSKPTPAIDTLAQNTFSIARNNADTAGNILVAPALSKDSSMLMIMDGAGHLLREKTTAPACCFNRWVINGTVRYTWIEDDPAAYHFTTNQLEGEAVIADANLNVINRVNLLPYNEITVANKESFDMHDFILISDNHYIGLSYYPKAVTNIPQSLNPQSGVVVITPVIQEVQNGQVIWQWDGSNYPEFYTSSVEGNSFYDAGAVQDYMHMNSMFIDPRDNNLICSFRNMNQIIKINRQTGDIIWRLGGANSDFPLSPDQQSLRQHNATLTDNNQTLLVFDNGTATDRPYTRILEYQLDEVNKTITSFKSYNVPEPQTLYTGSVQKIGTHYFIGGGTANYVLDIDYITGQKYLEMKGASSYRAYKY